MSQPKHKDIEDLVNSKKEELEAVARQIGATSLEQVFDFLAGRDGTVLRQAKADVGRAANYLTGGNIKQSVGRFAGSKPVEIGLRTLPAAAAVGAILGTGDVLLGNEGAGNKVMDAASMMAAGAYGAHKRGVLGGLAGAASAKIGSDVLQAILGGGV